MIGLEKKYYFHLIACFLVTLIFTVCYVTLIQNYAFSQAEEYVGVEKCKACHPKQYHDFSQRHFEKAWRVLKMRNEDKNPECLKCHTTGYDKPGGFSSEEETPYLTSKQCESCHGPGSRHMNNPADPEVKQGLKVANKKNVCIECHLCMKTHHKLQF